MFERQLTVDIPAVDGVGNVLDLIVMNIYDCFEDPRRATVEAPP